MKDDLLFVKYCNPLCEVLMSAGAEEEGGGREGGEGEQRDEAPNQQKN